MFLSQSKEAVMFKVIGAASVVLLFSGFALSVLEGVLGAYAEAASVGLMGLGLLTSSQILGSRAISAPVEAPEGVVSQ